MSKSEMKRKKVLQGKPMRHSDELASAVAAIGHLREALKNLLPEIKSTHDFKRSKEAAEHALSATSGWEE